MGIKFSYVIPTYICTYICNRVYIYILFKFLPTRKNIHTRHISFFFKHISKEIHQTDNDQNHFLEFRKTVLPHISQPFVKEDIKNNVYNKVLLLQNFNIELVSIFRFIYICFFFREFVKR